jgi:hypothetical protein
MYFIKRILEKMGLYVIKKDYEMEKKELQKCVEEAINSLLASREEMVKRINDNNWKFKELQENPDTTKNFLAKALLDKDNKNEQIISSIKVYDKQIRELREKLEKALEKETLTKIS